MNVRILAAASLLGFASISVAQGPPGNPMKTGSFTLTVDGKKVTYDRVQGSINEAAGYRMAGLTFGSSTGDNLQVSAMGLIEFGGQLDYAADCSARAALSNSAGLA